MSNSTPRPRQSRSRKFLNPSDPSPKRRSRAKPKVQHHLHPTPSVLAELWTTRAIGKRKRVVVERGKAIPKAPVQPTLSTIQAPLEPPEHVRQQLLKDIDAWAKFIAQNPDA
ncbi:hypothetical protein BDV98DRAFT_575972 [Pterulicium gracile]|uniref:Uncharacterized protein n=1 Tax=Pterulicium gracile TaxID=1884261 RepID=A0A5C3Q8V1_9AGAR|nr:hypothetical protein BDV98DRAFT_575972 [Pterula gracilis]